MLEEHVSQTLLEHIDATLERLLRPLVHELMEKMQLPDPEWFSIKETARITGLSENHIRRHVTSGLLPAANHSTFEKPLYRIHRKDIDAWADKRRENPHPAPRKKKKTASGPGTFSSRHHRPKNAAA